jgi:voltage-gated potassium channel Kch
MTSAHSKERFLSAPRGVDFDPHAGANVNAVVEEDEEAIAFDFNENAEFVAPFSTFQLRDKINFAFEGIPDSFAGIEELRRWMTASSVISNTTLLIVIVSCVNFAVDTLPSFWNKRNPVTFGIEAFCIGWFTIDVFMRFITTREKKTFFLTPLNMVDIISILPFYVDVISRGFGSDPVSAPRAIVLLMILRFTRLTRVLKLSKHNTGMQSIIETFRRSGAALSLMFVLLFIAVMAGATAIYFAEQTVEYFDRDQRKWIRQADGEDSPFQSIYHAFWFSLVTITTVGYGDERVTSLLGKFAASALMLIGVFVIAFPTVILSSNFHDIHNSRLAARELVADKLARMANDAERERKSSHAPDAQSDDEMDEAEQQRMMFLRRRKLTTRRVSYTYVEKELALEALEYAVPGEPNVTRGIFLNGYRAEYAPQLTLLRELPKHAYVERDDSGDERPIMMTVQPNFPTGVIVSFVLILHTKEVQAAAQKAVDRNLGPAAPLIRVVPRPIRRLTVTWSSPHQMLSSASVVTKAFRNPRGQVTLQIYLPFFDALPALLRYNAGASFHFAVDYEDPIRTSIAGTEMPVAAKVVSTDAAHLTESETSSTRSSFAPSSPGVALSFGRQGGLVVPSFRR